MLILICTWWIQSRSRFIDVNVNVDVHMAYGDLICFDPSRSGFIDVDVNVDMHMAYGGSDLF